MSTTEMIETTRENKIEVIQTKVYKTSDGIIYENEIDANMAQLKIDFDNGYKRKFNSNFGYKLDEVYAKDMFNFLLENKNEVVRLYQNLKDIKDIEKNRLKNIKQAEGGLSISDSHEKEGLLSVFKWKNRG